MNKKEYITKMRSYIENKKCLVSILCGMLVASIMIMTAIMKDNVIDCKIIYDFNHEFGYDPCLFIEGETGHYEIQPRVPSSDTYEIVYSVFEERYKIPYEAIPTKSFSIQLLNDGHASRLCSIEFYNHGYLAAKLSPSDIQALFDTSKWETKVTGRYVDIAHEGRIQLNANELFCDELTKYPSYNRPLYLNSIFWGCIIGIGVYVILYVKSKNVKVCKKEKLTKAEIVLALGLFTIFALAFSMSFLSKHYAHPDETVTRLATDYYLSGWLRPDMDSSMVAGTFSLFGFSRLDEPNLYYLLAGKVGWIFREFFYVRTYYRMFNIMLLAIMLYFCWKKRKNHTWALVALCMTPQIWYLFSYATSDAWDWFCGFVMVYMLLRKEDYLYRQESVKRLLLNGFIYALIFAMILLGKSNYLALLGVAFVDFLLGWFQYKEERIRIFVIYLAILAVSFGLKMGIENMPKARQNVSFVQIQYETKSDITQESSKDYGVQEGKPRKEGISLFEVAQSALGTIFESANGCYMWMSLDSGRAYYMLMALTRVVFLSAMISVIWKNRKGNLYTNIKSIYSVFNYFLMVAVVILYCWAVTFQPQGRYLLLVWLIMGYMCAQYKDVFDNKAIKGVIAVCMCAGFWSFAYCGVFSMLRDGNLFISYERVLKMVGVAMGILL